MIKFTRTYQYGQYLFWVTSNRKIGISFLAKQIDLECANTDQLGDNLTKVFRSLSDDVRLRFQLYSETIEHSTVDHARSTSLLGLGETFNNVVFHFETRIEMKLINELEHKLESAAAKLLKLIPLEQIRSIGVELTNLTDISAFFWDIEQPIVQVGAHLDTGFEKISVIKLIKASNSMISLETMAELQLSLPKPFEIHVNINKVPNNAAKVRFLSAAKRDEQTNSVSGQTKSKYADQAVAGMEFNNESYLSFEWHLVIRRKSEIELRTDSELAFNELSKFSEFYLETIGTYPSFASLQLGSDFHFKGIFEQITEKDEVMGCYLPICTYGTNRKVTVPINSYAFHRLDGSIDYLDQFDPAYSNANLNIVGISGKGKSVFINGKIRADAFDPDSKIIVVDVKGSHTRLINSLGGDVYNINLKTTSGINPIAFLKQSSDEKALEIVKTFLSELCLDDEEKKLNEVESSQLEEILVDYAEQSKSVELDYSMNEFIEFIPESFARKMLLKRFSNKGILRHIFSEGTNASSRSDRNRIRYYNFQNIDTAANTAVSRAIMAAIMADFSFTLSTKDLSERLLFISDETPFFIKHCFRSFSLLSKNVRALNGSLMLTVQLSCDLVVDGDKSLIDTAGTNIFLSGDETKENFKERFNLNQSEVDKVFSLSGVQGKYSQFLIKDQKGSRIGNLFLSKKEYWQATTKPVEMSLIEKIKSSFPNLDEDTILELISRNQIKKEHGGFL